MFAVFYFHLSLTALNVVGMCIAGCGAMLYTKTVQIETRAKQDKAEDDHEKEQLIELKQAK